MLAKTKSEDLQGWLQYTMCIIQMKILLKGKRSNCTIVVYNMTNIDAITKSNVENKNNSSVQRLYSLGIKSDKGSMHTFRIAFKGEIGGKFVIYKLFNYQFIVGVSFLCCHTCSLCFMVRI